MFLEKPVCLGPLEVLQSGPLKKESGGAQPLNLVLFHGYGANCHDLYPLHREVRLRGEVQWTFPNGPLEIEIAPGFSGRAWFPIDVQEHERAQRLGQQVDYSQKSSARMHSARDKALSMLKELNCPLDRLVLGGFSQGAMLAMELTLSLPQPPLGVVLLSGTLVDQPNWSGKAKHFPGLRFFQSHGKRDPILPHEGAQKLEGVLKASGWEGELVSFNGGHEIPFTVLQSLSDFLQSLS